MVRTNNIPYIEHNKVTFIWEGSVCPYLVGDFNQWETSAGIPLKSQGKNLWQITLDFPLDAYIEYAFVMDGKIILDPRNPHKVSNGMGQYHNYFYMPNASPSPYTKKPQTIKGKVLNFAVRDEIRISGLSRRVTLYHPQGSGPFPLLVVFDGNDYLQKGKIISIVENLIAEHKIKPIALALIANARKARFIEYACNDSTVSFIMKKIIPLAQNFLPLLDPLTNPGAYSIMGASMGGTMALYVAIRHPEIFGKVISQAGAFCLFDEDFSIFDLIERTPKLPIKIWMDVGRFDFVYQANQRMYRLLLSKDYDVTYHEVNGGHNYTTWRNDLPIGLMHLFS